MKSSVDSGFGFPTPKDGISLVSLPSPGLSIILDLRSMWPKAEPSRKLPIPAAHDEFLQEEVFLQPVLAFGSFIAVPLQLEC